jgi:hypothetical protein
VLDGLDELEAPHRFVFLDAGEETLLTRYKETRRRHPLAPRGGVSKGIALERALLAPLKEKADLVIATDELKAAGLRRRITDELLPRQATGRLAVTFQSFGFKHGPPRDADLAFDVRFLPNPHYVPDLKPLTGPRPADRRLRRRGRAPGRVLRAPRAAPGLPHAPVRRRGQGAPRRRDRLHGRQAPLRRDLRAPRRALPRLEDLFVDVVHRDIDKR